MRYNIAIKNGGKLRALRVWIKSGFVARCNIGAQGVAIMATKKSVTVSNVKTEKKFLSVAEVFGKFPKITCDIMRANDLPSYSAIVGALAKDNRASIDIPLALNPSGKELFNIGKITRVFYAVSQFYDSKVKIDIIENTGLNGDSYFTIHLERVVGIIELQTRKPDKMECKQESSRKRAEKAQENKTKKENEVTAQVETRAKEMAKTELQAQTNALANSVFTAIEKRLKAWNINIADDKLKMLKNDIIATIEKSC